MAWIPSENAGPEAQKIKYLVVPYTRGTGVSVGPDEPQFPHWKSVESVAELEPASQDFVVSSHYLNTIAAPAWRRKALEDWWRVLKPGGHLVLYLPHAALCPHGLDPLEVSQAMLELRGWDLIVDDKRDESIEFSLLRVYRKRADDEQHVVEFRRPKKSACVVRYGGFGDMIQTANILPGLKRQGFHVAMMTTPKGQDILRHDPHVDEWIIQDDGQVPNPELANYWFQWSQQFERFVNLSESVEGTLLATPGRINHLWPHSMRHKYLNINYGEFAADIAEVPYRSDGRFYPSSDEIEWRNQYRAERIGDGFAIMWALAGSSLHKFYPWMDSVIAKVMLLAPRAKFVLVGDYACQILEQGWELEDRVIRESGKLSIRKTLALAQVMHCVVGPETGVLNAVGFDENVGKVCMLSHSSRENLTKHWRNSFPVEPHQDVGCYPCHRLHYNDFFCRTEENSGAAICQFSIDPERVFQAIQRIYARWDRESRRSA